MFGECALSEESCGCRVAPREQFLGGETPVGLAAWLREDMFVVYSMSPGLVVVGGRELGEFGVTVPGARGR